MRRTSYRSFANPLIDTMGRTPPQIPEVAPQMYGTGTGPGNYGTPPYHGSSLKAALALALSQGGTTFGAGLGAVPRGANFGTAFLASAGGASRAYSAAQQAAQEYALKQQAAQQEQDFRNYQKANITSEIAGRADEISHRAKEDAKLGADRQKFNDLTDPTGPFKMNPVEARQVVYGLTSSEQTSQKKANAAATGEGDTSWIDSYVTTTRSGKKFLDISQLQGKDHAAAVRRAAELHIPAVGATGVGQLQDVASASANVEDVLDSLHGLLPADAQTRAGAYAGIELSKLMQTNAQRSAFATWRGSAIRTLRATAGSKGLRLNQKEIDLAVKYEIPQITDTYDVANQKMAYVKKMLHNAENPILQQNWGPANAPSGGVAPTDADNAYLKSLGL